MRGLRKAKCFHCWCCCCSRCCAWRRMNGYLIYINFKTWRRNGGEAFSSRDSRQLDVRKEKGFDTRWIWGISNLKFNVFSSLEWAKINSSTAASAGLKRRNIFPNEFYPSEIIINSGRMWDWDKENFPACWDAVCAAHTAKKMKIYSKLLCLDMQSGPKKICRYGKKLNGSHKQRSHVHSEVHIHSLLVFVIV